MSQWQPIEIAPKDGTRILIHVPHGSRHDEFYYGTNSARWDDHVECWVVGGELWDDACFLIGSRSDEVVTLYGVEPKEPDEQPTHWMPLPEPPVSSANEQIGEKA